MDGEAAVSISLPLLLAACVLAACHAGGGLHALLRGVAVGGAAPVMLMECIPHMRGHSCCRATWGGANMAEPQSAGRPADTVTGPALPQRAHSE